MRDVPKGLGNPREIVEQRENEGKTIKPSRGPHNGEPYHLPWTRKAISDTIVLIRSERSARQYQHRTADLLCLYQGEQTDGNPVGFEQTWPLVLHAWAVMLRDAPPSMRANILGMIAHGSCVGYQGPFKGRGVHGEECSTGRERECGSGEADRQPSCCLVQIWRPAPKIRLRRSSLPIEISPLRGLGRALKNG